MNLAEYLKQKREQKNLSLRDIEKITNISNKTYHHYEKDGYLPNAKNMFILIKILDLDIDILNDIFLQD